MDNRHKEFLAWAAGTYTQALGVQPKINWGRDLSAVKKAFAWADEAYEEESLNTLKAAYKNFLADPFWRERKCPILTFLSEPHKFVVAQSVAIEPEVKTIVRYDLPLTDEEISLAVDKNPAAFIRALRVGTDSSRLFAALNPALNERVKAYLKANYLDVIKQVVMEPIEERKL